MPVLCGGGGDEEGGAVTEHRVVTWAMIASYYLPDEQIGWRVCRPLRWRRLDLWPVCRGQELPLAPGCRPDRVVVR